jgi:hypothetical protein
MERRDVYGTEKNKLYRISVLIKWTRQPQSGKFREGSGNLPLWGVAAGTCKLIVLETG